MRLVCITGYPLRRTAENVHQRRCDNRPVTADLSRRSTKIESKSEVDRDLRNTVEGLPMLVDEAGEPVVCATCGRALQGDDPDEDPNDQPDAPICGECYRERDHFIYEIPPDAAGSGHD
jgi:hypothetical protein